MNVSKIIVKAYLGSPHRELFNDDFGIVIVALLVYFGIFLCAYTMAAIQLYNIPIYWTKNDK